jgi:hypothetical protein
VEPVERVLERARDRSVNAPGDYYTGPYKVFVEWYDGRGYVEEEMNLRLERP